MSKVLNLYMPLAVTHILIPAILADIYRDHFAKKKFSLHYVYIAGLAGLLPDIDILFFYIFNLFRDFAISDFHRTYTHAVFFSLIFLILYFLTSNVKLKFLNKYKLKLNYIFLAITFGTAMHLALDGFLSGGLRPFYPFSNYIFNLNLIPMDKFGETFFQGLDAILLVLWLLHEEVKHKISDFI